MIQKIMMTAVILIIQAVYFTGMVLAAGPGAIQKQNKDTLDYYRLERKIREGLPEKPKGEGEVIEKKKAAPERDSQKMAEKLWVEKVLIDESKILSPEELTGITSEYEGRECSVGELFDLVDAINKLYADKRYYVAKAILPPQKVEAGKVHVKLVEGHLGQFRVEGNESTRDSFIIKRMSLKEGELIRLDTFEKDILYLNRTTDIDIRAKLKAGEKFGQTDAVLTVDEPQKYDFILFADNAGRKTVGRERGGIIFTNHSLFGIRDPFDASFVGAEGTLSGWVTYDLPVNRYDTRLGLSYSMNDIEYVDGPLEELDMKGDSSDLGVNMTHPFIVNQTFKLKGKLAYHNKTSTTEFGDTTLFDIEADDVSAGFDFLSRDEKGAWVFDNTLTYGEDNYGEDQDYFIYNLDLVRVHFFNDSISAVFRGAGQVSDSDLLPSFDQFQIGGMATVRGYPEGLLAGDEGYFVSAELGFAMPVIEKISKNKLGPNDLKFFLFVDHGGVFPYKGNNESIDSEDYLTSTGCGLDINFSKYFSGRISVGVPLTSREDDEDSATFHFYIQSKLY